MIICFICKGDHINITDIGVLTSLPQHYDDPKQVKSLYAQGKFIAAGALHIHIPAPALGCSPSYIFMKCLNEIAFYRVIYLIKHQEQGCCEHVMGLQKAHRDPLGL